jgi:hypothetical protein
MRAKIFSQPQRSGGIKNWPCYLLIGALALLAWGQTATYDFVWDDQVLVVENQSIRSLRNLPAMFDSLEAQTAQVGIPSFRPLRTAWYAVLEAIGGGGEPKPWIFHLSNVLWHAAAAILLFSVALALFELMDGPSPAAKRIGALLVAAGFALHPANSEPVCWVKCLDDLMAGVFVLASTRCLLHRERDGKIATPWFGAAVVFYILAIYGKESAVPFAAIVFFVALGIYEMPWRKAARFSLPFFGAAILFMAHRHLVMGRTSQYVPLSGTYGRTLIDMLPVVGSYLRLAFGIPPFCVDYNYMVYEPAHSILSGAVLGGVLLLIAAIATAFVMWRDPRWRLVSFGLIWAGLFMLPVSNLVPMMQYMAERFLYVPLPGILIALGAVLLRLPQPRAWAVAGGVCVLIWGTATLNRMTIWRDDVTLFVRTSLEHPGIKRVEDNAVAAIFRLPAMSQFFPDYIKTKSIRMAGSMTIKQAEPVIQTLTQAHNIFPTNQLVGSALAFAYAKAGQWKQAVDVAGATAAQHPDSANQWLNYAMILRGSGGLEKAREVCGRALAINPNYAAALRFQATLCEDLKDFPDALAFARKLESIEPKNPDATALTQRLEKEAGEK